jgi:hypothetical protein
MKRENAFWGRGRGFIGGPDFAIEFPMLLDSFRGAWLGRLFLLFCFYERYFRMIYANCLKVSDTQSANF